MKSFLQKIVLLLHRIPGWLFWITILVLVLGGGVFVWMSLWYINGSKLAIKTPAGPANIVISGSIYVVDYDWSFQLPWKEVPTTYGVHIHLPYQKRLSCISECPLLDIARGKYEITATGMTGYDNWTGTLEVQADTVGSFVIPALPEIDLTPFVFAPEINLIHRNDQASLQEQFPQASSIIYNPFERIAYIQGQNSTSIYELKSRTRIDLLSPIDDVSMIKRIDQDYLISSSGRIYVYDVSTSDISVVDGLSDISDSYTLLTNGDVEKDGIQLFTLGSIKNIHIYEDQIVLSLPDGYFVYKES